MEKAQLADRFIPNRSGMNLDACRHSLLDVNSTETASVCTSTPQPGSVHMSSFLLKVLAYVTNPLNPLPFPTSSKKAIKDGLRSLS